MEQHYNSIVVVREQQHRRIVGGGLWSLAPPHPQCDY